MDINMTLIVQMLVFAVFVWFTMKFVWPPLEKALDARKNKIADGLSAAERGQKELQLAQHRINEDLKMAKADASQIIDKANRRAYQIIDEAKETAKAQAGIQAKILQDQLQQAIHQAKDQLRKQIGSLAIDTAEKILNQKVDEKINMHLVDDLIKEI